jgi:AcrR family transcriptional regulator
LTKQPKESAARRRIIDTATDLFYKHGIRATGTDAIIEAAGVARQTLYNHFETKDALVEAVLQEIAAGKREQWRATASDTSTPPRDRILALFDVVGQTLLGEGFRGCAFINAVAESPDRSSSIYCAASAYKTALAEAVDIAVRALDVANPAELTEQLMLLLDGATVRAQLGFAADAVPAARHAAALLIDAALN